MTVRRGVAPPSRLALVGCSLGGALAGGTTAGAAEALLLMSGENLAEYQALAYGMTLYGAAGLAMGVCFAPLLALSRTMLPSRAWSAAFSASAATLLLPFFGRIFPSLTLGWALTIVVGLAMFGAWLGGHLLKKTVLRVLVTPAGTVGAWLAAMGLGAIFSASPAPNNPDAIAPARVQGPELAEKPDVYLIVIEGLRADAMAAWGAPGVSPALDRFAAESVLFEQYVVSAVSTGPSIASLYTSQTPSAHGVTRDGARLPDGAPTLAQVLRDAGYITGGLPNAPGVSSRLGFDRGFDWYLRRRADPLYAAESVLGLALHARLRALWEARTEIVPVEAWHEPAAAQVARARTFLEANEARRLFLLLHFAEPELPWFPHPWTGRAVGLPGRPPADPAEARQLYTGEVRVADAALGAFFDTLRSLGRYEDALILVTSDHGEELGERGVYGNVGSLADVVTRVPLMIKLPGGARAGTTIPWQVRAVDLAPTVIEAAGLLTPPEWRGASLFDDWFEDDLRRLSAPEDPEDAAAWRAPTWADHPGSRPALTELTLGGTRLTAVRDAGFKLVQGGDTLACWDLLLDPRETRDVAFIDERCRRADTADALLEGWSGVRPPRDPPVPVDDFGAQPVEPGL
jgi:arylsulfatase A-like enzyme